MASWSAPPTISGVRAATSAFRERVETWISATSASSRCRKRNQRNDVPTSLRLLSSSRATRHRPSKRSVYFPKGDFDEISPASGPGFDHHPGRRLGPGRRARPADGGGVCEVTRHDQAAARRGSLPGNRLVSNPLGGSPEGGPGGQAAVHLGRERG